MTDSKEVSEEAVDRDAMLTNVVLYWQTGTAGSSARLYRFGAMEEPDLVVADLRDSFRPYRTKR